MIPSHCYVYNPSLLLFPSLITEFGGGGGGGGGRVDMRQAAACKLLLQQSQQHGPPLLLPRLSLRLVALRRRRCPQLQGAGGGAAEEPVVRRMAHAADGFEENRDLERRASDSLVLRYPPLFIWEGRLFPIPLLSDALLLASKRVARTRTPQTQTLSLCHSVSPKTPKQSARTRTSLLSPNQHLRGPWKVC